MARFRALIQALLAVAAFFASVYHYQMNDSGEQARASPHARGFARFLGSQQIGKKGTRTEWWKDEKMGTPSALSALSALGRHFVIHMEHRSDRMIDFKKRMDAAGLSNITVVSGIPHKCPQLGATLAHVAALQLCWASHWAESCVIMEDDFAWRAPLSISNNLIARFCNDVKDWDVLMLGCNLRSYKNDTSMNQTVPEYAVRVTRGKSSSGYAVKRAYSEKISSVLLDGAHELQKRCTDEFALDVVWGALQARGGWYTIPDNTYKGGRIGYQAASFSDIQRKFKDYGVR